MSEAQNVYNQMEEDAYVRAHQATTKHGWQPTPKKMLHGIFDFSKADEVHKNGLTTIEAASPKRQTDKLTTMAFLDVKEMKSGHKQSAQTDEVSNLKTAVTSGEAKTAIKQLLAATQKETKAGANEEKAQKTVTTAFKTIDQNLDNLWGKIKKKSVVDIKQKLGKDTTIGDIDNAEDLQATIAIYDGAAKNTIQKLEQEKTQQKALTPTVKQKVTINARNTKTKDPTKKRDVNFIITKMMVKNAFQNMRQKQLRIMTNMAKPSQFLRSQVKSKKMQRWLKMGR
uniref:Variant surface glycoprotein 1125.3158 n=1 Tax=Trypanosoma brucei TaxID=5691 RepID=A0A1J0R9C2_9TRYP|nr:variant surface glycoprotein 1125.3158 [Trypanosoma brucei]